MKGTSSARKYKIFLILIPMVFLAVGCNQNKQPHNIPEFVYKTGKIVIGGKSLNVQVADTEALRNKGLADRDSILDSEGMLFVFPAADKYGFWMKGMRFPLDIIWIYKGKVIGITSDVPVQPNTPDSGLKTYTAPDLADWVLEVNSGWALKNTIKVGDSVVDQF